MNEMLDYVNSDGIIQVQITTLFHIHCLGANCRPRVQTYFDHQRPRIDPVVCVNALSLFYTYGRGHELKGTLQWVYEVLLNHAYLDGTRYYETPECFLFFLMRLLERSGDADLHALLKDLLKERVQERMGAEGDALTLAMRLVVCTYFGLRNEVDLRALRQLQCEDGGWENGWFYKYGSSGIRIGNRGLTTVLAMKAVEAMTPSLPPSPSPTFIAPVAIAAEDVKNTTSAVEDDKNTAKRQRNRSSSFRNSVQWFLHATRLRRAVEF